MRDCGRLHGPGWRVAVIGIALIVGSWVTELLHVHDASRPPQPYDVVARPAAYVPSAPT